MLGRAAARGGPLERVEVHAHEVDELDVLLLGGDHVVGVVAQREQARVELRVQRLDPAAHDLGEAGEVLDRADLEARLGQLACGAAGRDELDAELCEPAREVGDAALVGHRQQRAPDADITWLRHLRRTIQASGARRARARVTVRTHYMARVVGIDRDGAAGDQRDDGGEQVVLDRAQRGADRLGGGPPGSSSARWAMIGPVSTPSSTKWTVTPNTFTP